MDSVGNQFPGKAVEIGHEHFDLATGGVYLYLGGGATNPLNWLLVRGVLTTDPDTSTWGVIQGGAKWYNSTDLQFKGWDGTQIVLLG